MTDDHIRFTAWTNVPAYEPLEPASLRTCFKTDGPTDYGSPTATVEGTTHPFCWEFVQGAKVKNGKNVFYTGIRINCPLSPSFDADECRIPDIIIDLGSFAQCLGQRQ